jgi:hypothetical protein
MNTDPASFDLTPFCLLNKLEHYSPEVNQILSAPFSIGDHTYASNGHICVRIPRRPDAPEFRETPDTSKALFSAPKLFLDTVGYCQLAPLNLPEVEEKTCSACGGRGTKHDCPNCTCPCPNDCNDGKSIREVFVKISGATFQANYVRRMLALPDLHVSKTIKRYVNGNEHMRLLRFRFDGGEGALAAIWGSVKPSITAHFVRAPRKAIVS